MPGSSRNTELSEYQPYIVTYVIVLTQIIPYLFLAKQIDIHTEN